MKVSDDAPECTLRQPLFSGPGGCYSLKGRPGSAGSIYVEDVPLRVDQDRILVIEVDAITVDVDAGPAVQ